MKISGRGMAYTGLVVGALASIVGNVTHTSLSVSTVSMGIRVPLAMFWPVALFIGIEVLVRVDWRRGFIDWFGRVLLVGPLAVVAAVVSYRHLNHLMFLAGEDVVSRTIGPLAIDGLMLGCTIALLAIRAAELARVAPEDGDAIMARLERKMALTLREIEMERAEQTAGRPAVPEIEAVEPARKPRAPRGTASQEQEKAVRLLVDGTPVKEAAEISGVSRAVVGRYGTVMRALHDNPQADVDCAAAKVRPELVAIIRDAANRSRL